MHVSQHAIQRHKERIAPGNHGDQHRENKIRSAAMYGRKIIVGDRLKQLLSHNCEDAECLFYGSMIVVISNETVVTVYKGFPQYLEFA